MRVKEGGVEDGKEGRGRRMRKGKRKEGRDCTNRRRRKEGYR